MTSTNSRIATALLLLRLSVFLVFLMWTLDKFVNPAHAAAVFENFYFIGGLGPAIFYILGFMELLILIGFSRRLPKDHYLRHNFDPAGYFNAFCVSSISLSL